MIMMREEEVGVHRPCCIILLLPVRPLLLVGITLANV